MNESVSGIIYKMTNLINGKIYVGQTRRCNVNYLGSGILLTRSIEKYGISAFDREIIEICESAEELDKKEIY